MRKCFHRNSPRVSPKRTTASPSVKGLPGNVDALRTPDRFFASPPPQIYRTQGSWSKIKGAQNFTTPDAIAKCHESFGNNTGKYHESPLRSITEQSIGSLSSQCTVRSFVSPTKEGILGCQNKFDPFLHKTSGACELCIFRLPDIEKERLDEQGRHLLVQFTTGGCRDCSAFPKASHEPQVRLCQRCYSVSHRQMQTRQRKKGNGSIIGYSFSKVSKGNLVYWHWNTSNRGNLMMFWYFYFKIYVIVNSQFHSKKLLQRKRTGWSTHALTQWASEDWQLAAFEESGAAAL